MPWWGYFIAGAILQLIGGYFYYHGTHLRAEQSAEQAKKEIIETNKRLSLNAARDRELKHGELLKKIREKHDMSEDLYVKDLQFYWIEEGNNYYSVGILTRILNRNNERAYVVNTLAFTGSISFGVTSPVHLRADYLNKCPFDNYAIVQKQYYIRPGKETYIDFELNDKIWMKIHHKEYPPYLDFDVKWFLDIDKEGILEIRPEGDSLKVLRFAMIKRDGWNALREGLSNQ